MSTGTIIAIVVVALILIALVAFALPRMRRSATVKARERELGQRRERVAGEHRSVANEREREAEVAEQRAQIARTEAERQRTEAELHQQRADMHERGMADDELIADHEREHFAPATESDAGGSRRFARQDEGATPADDATADPPASEPRRF
jgi:FtsZ-interacting cell division protein ZipA